MSRKDHVIIRSLQPVATPEKPLKPKNAAERAARIQEILRRLEVNGCGILRLKEGSLYPALYRLEEAGEIAASWEKEMHGRRGARGRLYRLTTKGHRKLAQGRADWQTFVSTIGSILLSAPA